MAEGTSSYQDISKMEFNTVELPSTIEIKESSIHIGEAGAFAKILIPKDTRFGPYKGEIIDVNIKKYIDYRFAWEVFEKNSDVLKHTICAMDPILSNWMRHVNCARFYEEQNILSTQEDFSIFYVAMKDIKPGEELLTWFDPKLIKRTKRRLSKMERKPVGYTIELVPWSDEKKFVPEIIETKRARKKKVLRDMISLDEDPLLITRTLQRLPKLPCTPKQLAQSAAYRDIYASLLQQTASTKSGKQEAKKDRLVKKVKGQSTTNTSSASVSTNKNIVSSAYPIAKQIDFPSQGNAGSSVSSMAKKTDLTGQVKSHQQQSPSLSSVENNSFIKPIETNTIAQSPLKPRRPKPRNKNRSRVCLSEMIPPKPTVIRKTEDGSTVIEDHDETYTLKNVKLQVECDNQCQCLDKQQASRSLSHSFIRNEKAASSVFVIQFSLLPEHRLVTPSNKVIYKCDICDSAYNHAFSLKRHYLGVHINHRYLTSSDIQSCQIETFHTGVQLEVNESGFFKISPGFQGVGNSPLPPSKDTTSSPEVHEVSENSSFCDSALKNITTKELIPTLSDLSKIVVNRAKGLQNDQFFETEDVNQTGGKSKQSSPVLESASYVDKGISPQVKEFSEPLDTASSSEMEQQSSVKHKGSTQGNEASACPEVSSSSDMQKPVINFNKENSPLMSCADLDISNGNSVTESGEIKSGVKDFTLLNNGKSTPTVMSQMSNSNKLAPEPQETFVVQHLKKLCEKQLCSVDTGSSYVAEVRGNIPNTGGFPKFGEDAQQSLIDPVSGKAMDDNTGDAGNNLVSTGLGTNMNVISHSVKLSLHEMDTCTKVSNTTKSCGDATNNQTEESSSFAEEHLNSSLQNECGLNALNCESEFVQKLVCREVLDSLSGEVDVKKTPVCTSDGESEFTDSVLRHCTAVVPVCNNDLPSASKDNSTESSINSKVFNSSTVNVDVESLDSGCKPATEMDAALLFGTDKDGHEASTIPQSNEDTEVNKTLSDPHPTENTTEVKKGQMTPAINSNQNIESSSAQTSICSHLCKAPLSSVPAQGPASTSLMNKTDSFNSGFSKISTPVTPQQLIFVTNIVFPIVAPSNAHSPTSALSSLSQQQSQLTTNTSGSVGQSTLNSPTAGVPLVLISQIPHGLNAANAFLQSSTALKTFQTLQKSINVVSLGNTATMLSGAHGNLRLSTSGAPLTGDMSTVSRNSVIGQASIVCQVSSSSQLASQLTSHSGVQAFNFIPSTSSSTPVLQDARLTSPQAHPPHSLAPPVKNPSITGQPDDLYRCHMCVLLFQTMNQLKHHIKNDPHRFKGCLKQYACVQCSMRFSNKTNLIRHNLMNHQEDENFKFRCYTCGKGFSTETYLKMHARFHSGKNFPCKYGCPGVFFPNAASLVKHLRTQHAGLDLKEYTKNVKAEKARRKKINRVFGMSDEQFPSIGLPEKETRVSSMPYSLNQPGIGFQAKRVKTKSPLTSSTPPDMKSLQSIRLETPSDHLMMKEEVKNIIPQAPKFQFKCKLCDKGFTTHLRLLQHRTQRHGASQSVQEYLYHMSKDVNEDDSAHYDSDQCEFSPPQSPKTFFANVNRRGFFNMKHHIDGGTESLLSWKKHLQVEGFVSISEPTLPMENTDPKMEWTFYNFPLYFQYQADCTQFYEEELDVPKLEKNALSLSQVVNEAGALSQIVHEPGQSQEIDSLTSILKSQPEEPVSKDGSLSGASGPVTIKTEAEEYSFGVKSQERSSYIISKLEQHLQGYYGQEQSKDLGSNKSVDDNHIKTEVFSEDEDINDKANNQNSSVTDNYSIASTKTKEFNGNGKDSKSNWPLGINKKTTNTCDDDLDRVVQNTVTKLENCTDDDDDAADPSAFSGLDSGISSLSSSECPSLDCSRPATWDQKNLVDSRDHISEPKELGVVKTVMETGKEIDKKKNLSAFSMAEKLAVLKSSFMQSINLESGLKTSPNVNKLPERINIDHSLTLIQALNLHITGSQLPMSKILAMIEKNQDLHFYPTAVTGRNRTVSLSSLGPALQNKEPQSNFDPVLNTSDSLKHDHRRYSIWSGQVHPKVLKDPEENTFCCPVVETVRKQEMLRLKEQYVFEKDTRDKEVESKQTQSVHAKLDFIEKMGLMTRKEFELSHHAKKQEEHIIKPPEIWKNYENIWFGKKGTITVVCSICHRHFSCWDLCLRHQLKKHPHIEPASLEMERDNDVEDLYYYYPMRYGILAQTQLIPDDLPAIEVYVCTRCGFPFKNINRLHSHIIACDPAQEEVVSSQNGNQKLSYMKKKLLPMMDRRLHQDPDPPAAKSRAGKSVRTSVQSESNRQQSKLSTRQSGNVISSLPKAPVKPVKSQQSHANFSTNFSFYSGKKHKNYELLYNPQNHTRRREQYKVLDQHQCHGCNLKFKSLSMLERHVKKCSGRDKLQSQKPLVSQVMPDDAALRKQHTCRYCSKRFTFIKGVDLHYKRICAVRKVKEDENLLTREDLAHEEELKRIIEHLKWSKTLNKDSSDIIQGHVRVEEDGTLTRVVKSRGGARSLKKNVKKKSSKWTSMKKHGNEDESSLSSSISNTTQSLNNSMEDKKTKPEAVFAESLEKLGKRLTRSSSLEKISPSSGSSLKRKSSVPVSVLDGLPTGKKNRSLSQSSSYSSLKNEDYSTATETRSGTSRKNEATSKKRSKNAQRNAPARKVRETKKKIEKSSQKRSNSKGAVQGGHEKSPGIQLPARKRGRPLKYDPSDTVYIKKKKPRNSTNQRVTGKEKGDEKKSLSRPSRSKTTLRVSKNEIVCETWESKQKAKTSSKTKKQTGIKNNQPIDTSMMIEKMKQLKEAAKLESENINKTKRANQAKRAELKKASASKKLEKPATLVGAGLVSRDLSPNKHSTELFKHLTKGNCKSSAVKEIQSSSTNSLKEKSTLQSPSSKSSSISTYNTLKRKSLEHASSAGTSQSKKYASSPRSPTVQIQSKSLGKSKNYSTLRTSTAISPKELTKTDSSKVIEKTPTQPATAKSSSKSSCSEVLNPVHKQQPVSVRVVTLSPNGMNLLTYDTPPGDFKSSVTRMSSSSIKLSPDISSIQQTKKVSTLGIHKEPIQILGKSPVQLVGKGPQSQNAEQTLQSMEKNLSTNFVIQKPNQVIQKPNQVIQVPGLKMSTTGNHIVYKCTESPADKANNLMVDPKPGNQMILKCTDGRLMHVVSDEDMCTYEDSDALLASVEKQRLSAPVAMTPESPSAPISVVSMPKSSVCHAVQKQGGVMNICTKPSPSLLISRALTSQGEQMKGGFIKQVQVVKDAADGEKVHFISPSVISQAAVASNVQMCGPILTPGNVSTVLAAPQVTKQTTASLVLPVAAKGSKLFAPSTRFGLPSPELPNIVHGGIVPTGTKVLKLGNIISAGASMTRPLTENVVSQVGKNAGLQTIVPEKSNLLNPRQMQRVATPVIRQQPPFTQKTTGCTPRSQVITVGRSAQTSNVQTVLIQHSPNSLSQPVQIQQPTPRNILTLPASSNIVPSGQVYPSSTSKVMTNGGGNRQPRNIQRPSSLLSNQIMISLDDGTTAMLDPDSLAQFLSMSPSLNKNEMESITGANTATTDPEHVMVNMAEIQPSCHVDEITWPSNGSVDLTDLPDCTSDF